ncbi:sensor histidine kinase [Ornithinimicrobium sp. Y1847]|uniref:sensor histidine kinase n=1 Tax=Ornithinimicrobium sp. Y1847 TaxID=3405419 RepID=UPI003B678A6A
MSTPTSPAPATRAARVGWREVLAPRGGDGRAGGVHRAGGALTFWQHAWRIALVWVLGLSAWMVVGMIATEGWQDDTSLPVATLVFLDLILGQVAVGLVLFRRRWPVPIAIVVGALCLVSSFALPASLLAIISLATLRHVPSLAVVIGFNLLVDVAHHLWIAPILGTEDEVVVQGTVMADGLAGLGVNTGFVILVYAIAILIGWNIGSRRELVASWRSQAEVAVREQSARVAQAQLAERARIAREMHDVLAHRLSLVAMHAGVLAHRDDLPAEERRQAAEVVRSGAHQALEELREVLGVLRADDDGPHQAADASVEAPQPGLSGIPSLVAEVTSSGQEVRLVAEPELWARSVSLPTSTGRHVYRVVQEALTNGRRHAQGRPVTVELDGRPGTGLSLVVSNPVAAVEEGAVPSGGRGLTGMAERVQLAGGRFEAGVEVTDFVVRVWLPWEKR